MKRSHRIVVPHTVESASHSPVALKFWNELCLVKAEDPTAAKGLLAYLDCDDDDVYFSQFAQGWFITREAGAYLEAVAAFWHIHVDAREATGS